MLIIIISVPQGENLFFCIPSMMMILQNTLVKFHTLLGNLPAISHADDTLIISKPEIEIQLILNAVHDYYL